MFLDHSRKVSRKKSTQIRLAAVSAAVLTCFLVYLLYLVSRPGYSELQPAALSRSDLLVAMTATTQRMLLPEATRAWREGVPTVIVMETGYDLVNTSKAFQEGTTSHLETFADYPDLTDRHFKLGDMRACMAPFIANNTAGIDSYKWMLFGDDDTVFYVDNILRMLETLDHTMPYILSDHIWFPTDLENFDMSQYLHPNRIAPRCLPCNYTDPAEGPPNNKTYVGFRAPRACPCTPKDVCASDNLGLFADGDCNPRRFHWFWPHGGAGMIFSQGLMRMRGFDQIEQAVRNMDWGHQGAGDMAIAYIFWEEFGIMATDPGYGYFRPGINLFDPGWRLTPDGHDTGTHAAAVMDRQACLPHLSIQFEMALQGWCNEECEDQLQHLISVHLGARESAWHHRDIRKALKHHPSQAAADDEDLGHMHVGLFLHTRLAYLFKQYSAARRLSRVAWMSHVYDPSDPPI
ncbi:hypothetical protein ABBQ38_001760 [Trebouxia sp. C0009 RCD-2024]